MKKSLCRFMGSALMILTLNSCEKEINNIKYPEFVPKWNISGYLSPDNSINTIIMDRNFGNYGSQTQLADMGNPILTLSDGTNQIVFDTFSRKYKIKKSDFPIEEGKTYSLKIRTDKGYNAEALCTVPFRGKLDLEVDTTIIKYTYENYGTYLSVHTNLYFTDIKGIDNYYMVFCEEINYSSLGKQSRYISSLQVNPRPYLNDKGKDGLRSKVTIDGANLSDQVDSSFLKVYMLNTDKAYYEYRKSVEKYRSGEDPFTEASPVYSNITGGLGIFAAYTVDSLTFRLK